MVCGRGGVGRGAVWAACGVVVALGQVAWAQPRQPTPQERLDWIADRLDEQRVEHHVPGMALAVIAGGRVVLVRGFGVADAEAGREVTPETRFAVGSTTKAMTATLVAMLADEGKLGFDDLASERVPGFRFADDDLNARATIRDLLSHRSGLAAMEPLWYGLDTTSREILAAAARAEPLNPLREKFVYCNVGYLAAGLAAAHAAGTDWDTLIADRLFGPLGMVTANSTYAAAQADPEMARGYMWDPEKGELVHQPMRRVDGVGPAGSVNASVLDMTRWVLFQLGRGQIDGVRLLSEERHAETWHKHSEMSPGVGYGLGWMLRDWEGVPVVEHAGGIDGFTAQVSMIPTRNAGYVLLMNLFGSPLQESSRQVVYRGLFGDISESAEGEEGAERFVGRYVANFGPFKDARFTVTLKGGKLFVDVPGQMNFELAPPDAEGKRKFTVTDQIAVRFDERDGKVVGMTLFQGGMTFETPREGVEIPPEMTAAEAEEFAGEYRHEQANVTIRVLLHNGRLAIDVPGQMIYELHPPDAEGVRSFRATDAIRVRFNRDEQGRVVSLTHFQAGRETLMPRVSEPGEGDRLPTVDEVLALVQRGGSMDTEGRLRTVRVEGTMRFINIGIEGRESTTAAADGRFRMALDFGRFGRSESIIGRERGWSDSTAAPDRDLTIEQFLQARMQSPLALAGDWRKAFDRIVVDSRGEVDGRAVIAVRLERDGAKPATVRVDAETGLPVSMETQQFGAFGQAYPLTYRYEDWRDVGGVLMPHRVWMDIPMVGRIESVLARAEANVAADDSVFEPPARD
ncbi:MAG: hypothetical protein AMXMBFR77_22230 [Phycisphaerales bacterium]|nr:beta-lactamase family protein [Phycisphaerales bacterium]GIK18401.1 MAG: hypothetical protein BroJett004_05650 [Planctomycetota bacterium]